MKFQKKIPIPHPPFNRTRILFTWFIVFLAMSIYAIAWFSCGLVVMPFIDAISNSYSFSDPWNTIVSAVKLFFLYHPIIAIIGWIIWGFINSLKRDVEKWRTPY